MMDLDQGFAYISFGIVLFVWEFLPTFIVVLFFRVHRPQTGDEVGQSTLSTDYFHLRCLIRFIVIPQYKFVNKTRGNPDDDKNTIISVSKIRDKNICYA